MKWILKEVKFAQAYSNKWQKAGTVTQPSQADIALHHLCHDKSNKVHREYTLMTKAKDLRVQVMLCRLRLSLFKSGLKFWTPFLGCYVLASLRWIEKTKGIVLYGMEENGGTRWGWDTPPKYSQTRLTWWMNLLKSHMFGFGRLGKCCAFLPELSVFRHCPDSSLQSGPQVAQRGPSLCAWRKGTPQTHSTWPGPPWWWVSVPVSSWTGHCPASSQR